MAVIEALYDELRQLGVMPGEVLLVHSSLNALRCGDERDKLLTPHNIIDTLMAVVGEGGTLLLPALSYATVTEEENLFDVRNTPCCVGIIPETFRTAYSVLRSVHPTHSVCAWGKMSALLTKDHILDRSPLGKHSPFRLLPGVNGKILMLGCGLKPMTFMHGVEEQFHTDYVMSDTPRVYRFVDEAGKTWEAAYAHHDFAGYAQRYDRLADVMDAGLRQGKTLGGTSYLLESSILEQKALETLEKDQHYFVDRVS